MLYEQKFLCALLRTLLVEIPIVVLLLKYFYQHKKSTIAKIVLVGFIASALTLPYFWLVLPAYVSNWWIYVFGGEFFIVFIEAIIYNQLLELKLSEAVVVSLIANIASILFGLVF